MFTIDAARAGQELSSISASLRGSTLSGLIDQTSVPVEAPSPYRRYTLTKFLASPCLIHYGRAFSRRELVRELANNLGGAHLDFKGGTAAYEMLTSAEEWLTVGKRNPALFEVLSIGQIVTRSESIRKLRERIKHLGLAS